VSAPLLEVRNLSLGYATGRGVVRAVDGVDLDLAPGETLGIVGESGSGKSTLAYALLGHLAENGLHLGGSVRYRGEALFGMAPARLRSLRGKALAMVHQNPLTSLNPAITVGRQIAEVLVAHGAAGRRAAAARALDIIAAVNLPDPRGTARRYPHQLSGGQRQRVVIAMAIALEPEVLVLDEPTTNLDVTTEAVILDLLAALRQRLGMAMVYISHNLGVVARVADRVTVMYAGEAVETGPARPFFAAPRHPYAHALLQSLPPARATKAEVKLRPIAGAIPRLSDLPAGCRFQPRCALAAAECGVHPAFEAAGDGRQVRCPRWRLAPPTEAAVPAVVPVEAASAAPVLVLHDLVKSFSADRRGLLGRRRRVLAVDGASLALPSGGILGLVGESGSGKTTLLRCVAGLEEPDAGTLTFRERPLPAGRRRGRQDRREIQVVFQDPEATLNPRLSVGRNLVRHLKVLSGRSDPNQRAQVAAWLQRVRLDADYFDRLPDELSGGEKQRVAIARAFLENPSVVLCDEPLSALDVSVQASVVQLLLELQAETGSSYLLISHDIAVVRYMADVIAVMYFGWIVELGPAASFAKGPLHPYTQALLSARTSVEFEAEGEPLRLEGSIPDPADPPSGCVFHTRCPRRVAGLCEIALPPWRELPNGRRYRCHLAPAEL